MSTEILPPLVGGPYKTPRVRPGHSVACLVRGEVEVDGLTSDVPVSWPYINQIAGNRSLLLFGALARAVRAESVAAVAAHWGVSRYQVTRWRRALGVPRMTAGTKALWVALAPSRLSPESRHKGGEATRRRHQRITEGSH